MSLRVVLACSHWALISSSNSAKESGSSAFCRASTLTRCTLLNLWTMEEIEEMSCREIEDTLLLPELLQASHDTAGGKQLLGLCGVDLQPCAVPRNWSPCYSRLVGDRNSWNSQPRQFRAILEDVVNSTLLQAVFIVLQWDMVGDLSVVWDLHTSTISWCRDSMRAAQSGLASRLGSRCLWTAGRVSSGNGAKSSSLTPSLT